MPKKSEAKKLIVVKSAGPLSELGGIGGPILNPCYVPISIINKMINKHRLVYEVNPHNYKEEVRLNLKNLKTNNFKSDKEPVILAPSAQTIAVVKNAQDEKAAAEASIAATKSRPVSDFLKK